MRALFACLLQQSAWLTEACLPCIVLHALLIELLHILIFVFIHFSKETKSLLDCIFQIILLQSTISFALCCCEIDLFVPFGRKNASDLVAKAISFISARYVIVEVFLKLAAKQMLRPALSLDVILAQLIYPESVWICTPLWAKEFSFSQVKIGLVYILDGFISVVRVGN